MSLTVDPTMNYSCSSIMSSEAAVCHNNCASVSITDPFMYAFLVPLMFALMYTLMQQTYGSMLLQFDGSHCESVWYPYWKCIIYDSGNHYILPGQLLVDDILIC